MLALEDLAAVLYPACLCRPRSAGPDGIRRGRPHLLGVLEGLGIIQAYFPAVRPVTPSFAHQPAQPFSDPLLVVR